jgi:hypothetical protein
MLYYSYYTHIGFKNHPDIFIKNWKERFKSFITEGIYNEKYNCYDIYYGKNNYNKTGVYFDLTLLLNDIMMYNKIKFNKNWYLLNIRHEQYYVKAVCQEIIFNNNELVFI